MFQSQASYTFNTPFLPFTPTVSILLLSLDDLTSSVGSPILHCVVDFISPSYSSSPFVSKHTATTDLSANYPDQDVRTIEQLLEDAVSRLNGNYHNLSTTTKDIQSRYGKKQAKTLSLPQKAHMLAEITHFKYHVKNLLCRLAVLTVKYPQEHLLRNAHRICVTLMGSQTFRSSLLTHKSSSIYELFMMVSNVPLTVENSIYQDCAKEYTKAEDHEESAKLLSLLCTAAKGSDRETSSSLIDMLMIKKTISHSDEDAEEESERHERSSTTSASSRANHEVDVPMIFGSSPESQKTTSAIKEKDNEMINMYELYDGCFFGDLTITFNRNDKLLFEDDNIIESNGHHTWRKHYNNNYNRNNMTHNFPMPPAFNSNQNSYPGFANPNQMINPSLLKTPPTQDQRVIPLNLFTLPQGPFMPSNTFAPFNPANLVPQMPVQHISTPPYNNKRAPVNQVIQPLKSLSEQKPTRDVSRESQSSLLSDRQPTQQRQQPKPQNVMQGANKASNSGNAPKNSHTQADKNVSAGKKGKSQNAKNKQEKGGFKLWDMINVQGKLKNF